MIELGQVVIHDNESSTQTRVKLLGLLTALGAGEVLATRIATALSETMRVYVLAGVEANCLIALAQDDTGVALEVRLAGPGRCPDVSSLRVVATDVQVRNGDPHTIRTRIPIGSSNLVLTPAFIERERSRVQQRSRRELMAELRDKNRQLEAHNEALEETVAERTAELRDANGRMRRDLQAGAEYVRGLIPPPMESPVRIEWNYIPSSALGGDTIGYHWLADNLLAFYLIDVTGHGLDSALLSITVINVIRAGTLQGVDMTRPAQVLTALNESFPGVDHGDKLFTMWYGVYNTSTRELAWGGGGHHPAVLLTSGTPEPKLLESTGPLLGAIPSIPFEEECCVIPPRSRLIISSDGVFEIIRDDRLVWTLNEFNAFLAERGAAHDGPLIGDVFAKATRMRGSDRFDDDFSIIEATFA